MSVAEVCPRATSFETAVAGAMSVEDEFICCVCAGVMRDPHQMPGCGHDFAWACVVPPNAQPTAEVRCPVAHCASTCAVRALRPVPKLASLIGKLTVRCENDECQWRGPWAASAGHRERECDQEPIACPFRCGRRVPRCAMTGHKGSCERRLEQCVHCLKTVLFIDRPLHESRCGLRPVHCAACGATVQQCALATHVADECPATVVACPFVEFGCPSTAVPRRDIDAHIEASLEEHCQHMMTQLRRERAQVADRAALLERRVAQLESEKGLLRAEAEAKSGATATTQLLGVLEQRVVVQQALIDRFLGGRVLTVDCRGAGAGGHCPTFTTINEAYAACLDGDMILVRPGVYREHLVLTRPGVWVRGADRTATVLEGTVVIQWASSRPYVADRPVPTGALSAEAACPWQTMLRDAASAGPGTAALDNLALSHMTIRNASESTAPAVRVRCGSAAVYPRIQDCTITSHNLACVVVDEGQPSIESCELLGSRQFGIFWRAPIESGAAAVVCSRRPSAASSSEAGEASFRSGSSACQQATGRIVGCTIRDNRAPNVAVERGAVRIVDTALLNGAANGLMLKAGSAVLLERCTVSHNAYSNVDVVPGAHVTITDSHLFKSSKAGLFVGGSALVQNTRIFENEMPNVVVKGGAVVELHATKVLAGAQYGVVVSDGGHAKLRRCEVRGNCFDNIVSELGAVVDLGEGPDASANVGSRISSRKASTRPLSAASPPQSSSRVATPTAHSHAQPSLTTVTSGGGQAMPISRPAARGEKEIAHHHSRSSATTVAGGDEAIVSTQQSVAAPL